MVVAFKPWSFWGVLYEIDAEDNRLRATGKG